MQHRWEPQSDYIRRHWLAGREEGYQQAYQEAYQDGRRASVLEVATLRLGAPDSTHAAAIADADPARVDALMLRVLHAISWDDLLGRPYRCCPSIVAANVSPMVPTHPPAVDAAPQVRLVLTP
jgi:hypothetical protein